MLALASVMVAACGVLGPEDQPSELDRNRELWENAALTDYEFALEQLCFCGEVARGPVRLQIVGGVATSRTYVSSGQAVPAGFEESFPTVEGLFDILRDAIDRDAFRIDVTYDPLIGVPVDIWIDYLENAADEERGFRITESVQPSLPN